jgi:GNAT superfamily N-acetyltransferase
MTFEIKVLSTDLAEVFTDYVNNMDFGHAPHWKFCNCQYYHVKCSSAEWRERTAEQNQLLAEENIRNGVMHGYLAFDGKKPVAWLNANDWKNYALLEDDEELKSFEGRTGIVVCFLVHPDYRRQALAKGLLERAVEDFRAQGFDRVIGRPFYWTTHPERQYHGVPKMYEELGFQKISETNGVCTYLLELK